MTDRDLTALPDPAWLEGQARGLAALVGRAVHPGGGFGWLGPENTLDPARPVQTWITCRMTHVAALATLRGATDLRPLLDVGYDALTGLLWDGRHGGWWPAVGETDKVAYAHAFVVLAAASLTRAGHPGGAALLTQALDVFDEHFWDEREGLAREQFDASWSQCEDYRGVNANMHTVEAMLAAGEVLGEATYTDRALRILGRVVDGFARDARWRLPEHFDAHWSVLPDYNRDRPADQFRPYGVTIGHVLEWSRLAVNARNAVLAGQSGASPQSVEPGGALAWLLPHARAMFAAAWERGWGVDGAPGFVYTTGFDDAPVVRERLHWVACEGIAAAWALFDATGDEAYRSRCGQVWEYARRYLIDPVHGGWFHELSPRNEPASTVWWGKPDLYHAYQATLVPLLPGLVSFAGAAA